MKRRHSYKQKKERRAGSPIKSAVYCPLAGKKKLVFESEDKALRYIAYNTDAISGESGYAPVRAYFCEACGGWHTTSKKYVTKNRE